MRHELQRDSDMGHGHFLNSTGRHGHFLNSTGRHWAFLKSTRKIRTPPSRAPLETSLYNILFDTRIYDYSFHRIPLTMYPRRHRQRQSNFALYLLAGQLLQVGLDRIPPVTLFSILGQVAIFLRLIPLKQGWPRIQDICISTDTILKGYDFKRLALAPFFHLDDWHLYYNMVSFLWKGLHLERRMGSAYFGYLLAVFSILTSLTTVGLGMAAAEVTSSSYYLHQCAAGFSGMYLG